MASIFDKSKNKVTTTPKPAGNRNDYLNIGDSDEKAKKYRYYTDPTSGKTYDLNELAGQGSKKTLANLPADVRELVESRKKTHHWFKMSMNDARRGINDTKDELTDAYDRQKTTIDNLKAPEQSADMINFLAKLRAQASIDRLDQDANYTGTKDRLLNQQGFNGKTTEIKDRTKDYNYIDSLANVLAQSAQNAGKYRQDAGKYVADETQNFNTASADFNNYKQNAYMDALSKYNMATSALDSTKAKIEAEQKAKKTPDFSSFLADIAPLAGTAMQGMAEGTKQKAPTYSATSTAMPTYTPPSNEMFGSNYKYNSTPSYSDLRGNSFGEQDIYKAPKTSRNYGYNNTNRGYV